MTEPSPYERYRQARRRAFARMAELRQRVDDWLDRHERGAPGLVDLAELEALHGERDIVVAELQAAENAMVETLLRRRSEHEVETTE